MYRMIGAALIALAAALLIGPRLIRYLKKLHFGQTIYELGPSHQQKQGTPVMGGLMMAAGILLGSLICHPAEWDGIWESGTVSGTLCSRCCLFLFSAWLWALRTITSKLSKNVMTD